MNFGLPSLRAQAYTKPNRLEDVLALIQVLALDESSHRSENGLVEELQGRPGSADSWSDIARHHPEFFRVARSGNHVVSLVARHVSPQKGSGREVLDAGFTGKLLAAAIDLHDRQIRRAERWTAYVPILVALIAALVALVTSAK